MMCGLLELVRDKHERHITNNRAMLSCNDLSITLYDRPSITFHTSSFNTYTNMSKTAVHSKDTNGRILKTYYVDLANVCAKCGRDIEKTRKHHEQYGKWCRHCCAKA